MRSERPSLKAKVQAYLNGNLKKFDVRLCNYFLHRAGFHSNEFSSLTLSEALEFASFSFIDAMLSQTNRSLAALGREGKTLRIRF